MNEQVDELKRRTTTVTSIPGWNPGGILAGYLTQRVMMLHHDASQQVDD